MNKKIFITGAEGFLGNHLTNFYIKKKYKVFCSIKKNLKFKYKNVKYFKCDIENKSKLKDIITKIKPNIIFHLAAKSHPLFSFKNPIKTISTNTIGTINILQSIVELKLNPKIVIACSSAQYGTRIFKELPLNEKSGFKPDHIYGTSKLFQNLISEQYFKMFNLKICNAIIFNTSGPGKTNDVFYDFSRQFLNKNKNKKIIKINCGNISNKRDFLHYKDTISALDIIAKKGKNGESYNVSTGKLIMVKSLLDYIITKSKKKIEINQLKENLRVYDEKYISGSNSKLKKLGWSPKRSYKEILDEMCKFKR